MAVPPGDRGPWPESLSPAELERKLRRMDAGEWFGVLLMSRKLAEDGTSIDPKLATHPDPILQVSLNPIKARVKANLRAVQG